MRLPLLAACTCLLGTVLTSAPAGATLQTTVGARVAIAGQPLQDCSNRASAVLNSVFSNAKEAGDGSAEWFGVHRPDPQSPADALAIIECHPQDSGGYTASFTCSAQVPGYAGTAEDLCDKLESGFGGAAK
jgi:hypothetical protein